MHAFLRIGAIAVTVFKVDAKILNRLAPQFLQDPRIDRQRHPGRTIFRAQLVWRPGKFPFCSNRLLAPFGQLLRTGQTDCPRKRECIGREFFQGGQRQRAQSERGSRLE